jgi:hypothetical protein
VHATRQLSKLHQDTTAVYGSVQRTPLQGCSFVRPTGCWYCILLKGSYHHLRRRRCSLGVTDAIVQPTVGLHSPYPLGRWVVNPNQAGETLAVDMPVAGHQVPAVEDPLSMAPATGTAIQTGYKTGNLPR